jgi:hypothetical protein
MAVEGKGQTVKIENGTSNRGAVLLAELKALVDTFPHHKRADVIKILETAFSRLNADKQSRHSVDLQPGEELSSTLLPPRPWQVPILATDFETKIKNRRKDRR